MKTYSCLLLVCVLWGDALCQSAKLNNSQNVENKNLFISNINNIIDEVLNRQWEEEESQCVQKTLNILRSVQNRTLWATWAWESMQNPTGVLYGSRNQFGNFDQCFHSPWAKRHPELLTQYCLANIVLTDKITNLNDDPYTTTDLYVSTISKTKLTMNKLTWGLCLPAICKAKAVKKFAILFLSNSHLGFALPQATVSIDSCQSYNENTEISYGYYAALGFIGSMILLSLLSTYYYENHRHENKDNYVLLIVKAFSIKENNTEFFKVTDSDIHSLNSIKFLASSLTVYLHLILINTYIGYKNFKSVDHFVDENNFLFLAHADILVDTFITISGILLMNNFLNRRKPVNIVNTIIKRYFRLVFLPMVIILFTTQVSVYHGTESLGPKLAYQEIENCRENWWTNLLVVNNYINCSKICLVVGWSIACDFHLTILGTCIYWLYHKNKPLGLKVFVVSAITSVVLPTLVSYYQQLSPIPFGDFEKISNVRKYANESTYIHSHLRSGPYFVGMAFGFVLFKYKPADNNKLSKIVSIIIFILGLGLSLFAFVFGGYLNCRKYSAVEAALFVGTNRSIWAIGIGLMAFSTEHGTLPLLSDFFRWPVFGPLNKLTFGVYLTHWSIITAKADNWNSIMGYFSHMVIDAMGVLVFCCGLSYVMWLVFETPVNNIIAIILRSSNEKSANGAPRQNGVSKIMKKIT